MIHFPFDCTDWPYHTIPWGRGMVFEPVQSGLFDGFNKPRQSDQSPQRYWGRPTTWLGFAGILPYLRKALEMLENAILNLRPRFRGFGFPVVPQGDDVARDLVEWFAGILIRRKSR